jgi:predicted ATPase
MPRARRFLVDSRVDSVTIDGFKSVREQTIHIGRLNVFIGANGSGKTALLEAIGVLAAAAEGRVDDEELLRRGVRPGIPSLFKSAFDEERRPRVIKLEAHGQAGGAYAVTLDNPSESAATPWRFASESLKRDDKNVVTRSARGGNVWGLLGGKTPFKPDDPYLGLNRRMPPRASIAAPVKELLSRLGEFVIYDPQTPILRGTAPDPRTRDPLGLQGGRLAAAVQDLLRVDAEPLFGGMPLAELFSLIEWSSGVDVSVPTPELLSPSVPAAVEVIRFTDRFMRKDRNRVSAYDASEGALYVLFALALLFHPKAPRFFAVENIDHTLHPRLARALMGVLGEHVRASGRQILLTTHNPLVLDGLDLADPDIRLFTVERTANGHTVVSRVEYTEALARAIEEGKPGRATLSEMWVRGLLGAVPSIA